MHRHITKESALAVDLIDIHASDDGHCLVPLAHALLLPTSQGDVLDGFFDALYDFNNRRDNWLP